MKILVVGGGGREHALVKQLLTSDHVDRIYCAPGNAGIAQQATCVDIKVDDFQKLIAFARKEKIDFTVVGPELPLVHGIVDAFEEIGMPIFGPSKLAAELEGSKAFAKHIMQKYNIPTAEYRVFEDYLQAKKFIEQWPRDTLVVKADGLAAGKGVIVCDNKEQAQEAIDRMIKQHEFGSAGRKVIIEERLFGEEISLLAISDGEHLVYMNPSQDHKRIFDGDQGPNTGGMGAYSPTPQLSDKELEFIKTHIAQKTIEGMALEDRPYRGVLYAGLVLTEEGPKVLEYNCRFGDPETQAVLPLADSDLLEVMITSRDGGLAGYDWKNKNKSAVCIVIASGGYPGKYEKGKVILGLDQSEQDDIMVYHAGTQKVDDKIVTAGGRVLGVTALGDELDAAIKKAYNTVSRITFDGAYYRRDIAAKALKYKKRG